MQRKNRIIRASRDGIAMIMAIIAIVIISTIMALAIAMTSQTSKRTTDLYLYEQSVLLAKDATEYALLLVAQNAPCSDINQSFEQDTIYTIDIKAQYIYTADVVCPYSYATVTTPEQNGSVLIDVVVSVNDTTVATEPIRYFKRTLQKL